MLPTLKAHRLDARQAAVTAMAAAERARPVLASKRVHGAMWRR
jgi:hypothetical protein